MDWSHPPNNYETLCMWKVFVCTCEMEVWTVVHRWYKKYGNPYIIPDNESMDDNDRRQYYQQALTFCYHRK